jgi:hypothetical protein
LIFKNISSNIIIIIIIIIINQSNEKSDTKKECNQLIKAKLGESLEKKWESKVNHVHYTRSMDSSLLVKKMHSRGDMKGEAERSGITDQTSCDKNMTKRHRQPMQTLSAI